MKRILILFFGFVTILCQGQINEGNIEALKNKILQSEKSGDNYSNDYANLINSLAIYYSNKGKYYESELFFQKVSLIRKNIYGINHISYATSLNNLAFIYSKQKKYKEAEENFVNSLKIYKDNLGENNLQYVTFLNNLGFLYYEQQKYLESEKTFLKVLAIQKEVGGERNRDYIIALNKLAELYQNQGKYNDAENFFLKSIDIGIEYFGENTLDYSILIGNLGSLYNLEKKYKEAEPLLQKALEIINNIIGKNNLTYATTLRNLAFLYQNQVKYSIAESLLKQSSEIIKQNFGENHPDYALSLNNLALLYQKQGKYENSENLFLNVSEIQKRIFGSKSPNYATSINNLATLYNKKAEYLEAEKLSFIASEIYKDVYGEISQNYSIALNNLALSYVNQGRYREAAQLHEKASNITKLIFGENSLEFAKTISILASIYKKQRKYSQSEMLHKEAKEIIKNILGEERLEYTVILNNLAGLYEVQGQYKIAEELYLKTINLEKKILGEKYPEKSILINNLASLYQNQKKFLKAVPLYIESLEISREFFGETHPNYSAALFNLGILYNDMGKVSEVESLLLKAKEINEIIYNESHPAYISNLYHLANFYRNKNLVEKSLIYFNQFIFSSKIRFMYDIYSQQEKELIEYNNFNKSKISLALSYLNDFSVEYPEINFGSFEDVLLIKNLSLRNQELLKKTIQKSGNLSLQDKYSQFVSNKKKLQKLLELPLSEQPIYVETLTIETAQLEKELINESTSFTLFKKDISINFNDIKNKLNSNEVLIDLVSFSYYKSKVTDSILYAAFVVGKDFKYPKFISLFEQKKLTNLLSKTKNQSDSVHINKHYSDTSISDLFLKPLEKELQGIKTIYLSPSGLGHQIDFSALPFSNKNTFGEAYNLHILSSPAELVNHKVSRIDKRSNIELLLYGGINYNKSESVKSTNSMNYNFVTDSSLVTRSGIKNFGYLLGTQKEVEQIEINAKQNGFKTTTFTDRSATEKSIKDLDGKTQPYVLHLATHGFFFPDPEKKLNDNIFQLEGKREIYKTADDPMMRSGLVFAGANNYWGKTNENQTNEDGILIASEISNLDLSACELVVLSACETGLGEINGSEGVFGLQRAFKMAGVKNIIMSLWKVPDAQTAELFDIFYKECFAGKTIHEAFKIAQYKMKVKYSPYYWAGFVLLE